MISKKLISALLLGAALVFGPCSAVSPAHAMTDELNGYVGPEPTLFDTPEAAIAAFKEVMAKGDLGEISKLLGLDAAKVAKSDSITDTVKDIQEAAAEGVTIQESEDERILDLGKQLWPFPFPIVKGEDGKTYQFDPNGPVSKAWLEDSERTGEWSTLEEVWQYGDGRRYYIFEGGRAYLFSANSLKRLKA